jgi:hypothetical protein
MLPGPITSILDVAGRKERLAGYKYTLVTASFARIIVVYTHLSAFTRSASLLAVFMSSTGDFTTGSRLKPPVVCAFF